jgi:type VII secretion integral membrane protein EccD
MTNLSMSVPRRITVVTPHTRADLALPPEATVSELIPQLISLVGVDAEDPTASSGGWVLGRIGADAYDPSQSVNAAGIQDGDTLYLSPRSAAMPPVIFDDVIDAIASAPPAGPGRWGPQATRWASLAAMVAVTGVGLLGLLRAGPPWTVSAAGAIVFSLLCVGASGALSRAIGDSGAGAVLASVGVVYAASAGAVVTLGGGGVSALDRVSLLMFCVGLVCAGALSALAVGDYLPWFGGVTLGGLIGVVASFTAVLFDLRAATVAASLAGLLLVFSPMLPALALRTSRLPLPHIPVDVAEFRGDERPTLDRDVLDGAGRADRFLFAYLAMTAIWVTGCAAALLVDGGGWEMLLVVLLGLVLPIRSRLLVGLAQRGCLIASGAGILLSAAASALVPLSGDQLLGMLLGVAVLAGAAMGYALRAPGRSPSPYWGRFLDIVEFLAAAAAIPVIAAVLHLYAWIRSLGG